MKTNVTEKTIVTVLATLIMLAIGDGHADEGPERAWQCLSHGHDRAIELYVPGVKRREGELSCWVVYTKEGASEILWQAKNNPDYCEPKALSLIARLESAGFVCTPSHPASRPADGSESPPAATDDSDVMMPPSSVGAGDDESGDSEADLGTLLSRHYEGNYLDAMLAALPSGFSVQPDMDAISPRPMEYLHVGPPDHFVKTLADGSYVLVNTLLFERGTTSSYVNVGFQVTNKRYRFLGYATTQPVADFEVLDAGTESVVLSLRPLATDGCIPARRTQVMAWQGEVKQQASQEAIGAVGSDGDCSDPAL